MNDALLEIKNLSIKLNGSSPSVILRDLNLNIPKGSTLGFVGESGSGKTMTALSIMGLLPFKLRNAEIKGKIIYNGRNLIEIQTEEHRLLRRRKIGMIFQNPFSYFDPSYRIRRQFDEMNEAGCEERIMEILDQVQLQDSKRILRSYPHELSGGQLQRLMIGLAILNHPEFLIADEPTTALDPSIKWDILFLLQKIKREKGLTLLLISHDLPAVSEMADFIAVLYRGTLVEYSDAKTFADNPLHPYSQSLMSEHPQPPIEENNLSKQGCVYAGQCPSVKDICREKDPPHFETNDGRSVKCWLYEK